MLMLWPSCSGNLSSQEQMDGSCLIFYFVALQDEPGKIFWFEQDALEACAGELVASVRSQRR